MAQVKVQIRPGGDIHVEGVGFTGKACDLHLDRIARALGRDPAALEQHYKPEYTQLAAGEQQSEGLR